MIRVTRPHLHFEIPCCDEFFFQFIHPFYLRLATSFLLLIARPKGRQFRTLNAPNRSKNQASSCGLKKTARKPHSPVTKNLIFSNPTWGMDSTLLTLANVLRVVKKFTAPMKLSAS